MKFELIDETDMHKPRVINSNVSKTKEEVEDWIRNNIKALDLDWRVGFTVKFRDADTVYKWRKIPS